MLVPSAPSLAPPNIEQVFTYADITMPNRPTSSSYVTAAADGSTTDVASEMTETETRQKQELEHLAEAHRISTEKSDMMVEAQRLEIEELKRNKRQAGLETRAQEHSVSARRKLKPRMTLRVNFEMKRKQNSVT
ncbi:hypothetical protein MHU86_14281 [Fragilaria crotonensis]|nr:hypothetical protein MHU86_14281 [Fragilaria crotonensis]